MNIFEEVAPAGFRYLYLTGQPGRIDHITGQTITHYQGQRQKEESAKVWGVGNPKVNQGTLQVPEAEAKINGCGKEYRFSAVPLFCKGQRGGTSVDKQDNPADISDDPQGIGWPVAKVEDLTRRQGKAVQLIDACKQNTARRNDINHQGHQVKGCNEDWRPALYRPGIEEDKPGKKYPEKGLNIKSGLQPGNVGGKGVGMIGPQLEKGGKGNGKGHARKEKINLQLLPAQKDEQVKQTKGKADAADKNKCKGK